MGQIFISHSAHDRIAIEFFNRLFSSSRVKAIYEEYEKIEGNLISASKIRNDIQNSSAIFVLLDSLIEERKHTRDWIAWECGTAKGLNKDVWVFEKIDDFNKVSVIIPHLDHFITYEANDEWHKYLKLVVDSYDDSNVLGTALLTTAAGASLSKDKWTGGLIGLGAGLFLANQKDKPTGIRVMCGECQSVYNIHVPIAIQFRCPVCNSKYQFQ